MDKNAIKKYAVWARRELIARVSQKALQYGITEKEIVDAAADSVNGKLLSADEKKQRQALIAQINEKGYKQVMEEVAYTWFNRFSALRFMEVNNYLPSHVRVFTDEDNNFKPQIITEAIHLDLDGLDMEKVYAYKDADRTEELYKYLLIVQCNALNKILPGMFQRISDYTELLLPDNLMREGSVIEQMITCIEEDDWKDAVQIIGWLYQYYNAEKKDDVFAALKKNVKITKENIPAATQLFTPDWIVRYMVENSLGRLWLEGHPNDELKSEWKYYLDEAEQEADVKLKLEEIRKEYAGMTPEQIKCIDPCSGSGHILAYMFDVLMQIYEAYGFTTREAVASIVENNIYGLDIDDRAAQLAYFSVMMKARQYDRRFFSRAIQPHIYAITESNNIDKYTLEYFCNGDENLTQAMNTIVKELHDAKEYGSILNITQQDWSALYGRFAEIVDDINMSREAALKELVPLVQCAEMMSQKYDVVVTNPPYMGLSNGTSKLNDFVKKHYPLGKADLCTCFMEKCLQMCNSRGMMTMINIPAWMSLVSFEGLRKQMVTNHTIISMSHFGRGVFGSDFGSVAFVIGKDYCKNYRGTYLRLFSKQGSVDSVEEKEEMFFNNSRYICAASKFELVPGYPIAYWLSGAFFETFSKKTIGDKLVTREGMATADNDRFLRFWHEVAYGRIGFGIRTPEEAKISEMKWFPYNKGGEYRKWYGNLFYVVNWHNDGFEVRNNIDKKTGRIRSHNYNGEYAFRKGLTWTSLSISSISVRKSEPGFLFDSKGAMGFAYSDKDVLRSMALLNSCVGAEYLKIFSPTVDFKVGDIIQVPYLSGREDDICAITNNSVELSRHDWDSFETSWDFKKHPLMPSEGTKIYRSWDYDGRIYMQDETEDIPWNHLLESAYQNWENECNVRFEQLKFNEEELNRIFIDIYSLQDELSPKIEDKDVTIRKADLQRDIKSLISYAVGCMFGRYSLDIEGLAYAGGEWDSSKYKTFAVDKDNVIPICDDEYFEDDIVGRFVKFIEVVYGEKTLEENLKFIADALGGKGQPKDVIRNYFLNDFYNDHLKMYQKRPIYWLFDSGKKNGFKALIYMHRYQPDIIARIRTDYVHEQQARYRTAIADFENRIASAATSERVKLNKKLTTLKAQEVEIRTYEEKIHHLADQMISIDLDDGVKVNYDKFKAVLAKIK